MKILKIVLILIGIALIVFGLYNAFIPQEIVSVGSVGANTKEGFSNQTLGMIGIGIFAFFAGMLIKNRG